MKKSVTSIVFSGLLSVSAYSQYTYSQNIVLTLTETASIPALPAKNSAGTTIRGADLVYENQFSATTNSSETSTYEFASKVATYRYSNKEVLDQLVEENVITSITGYTIVQVSTDNSEINARNTFRTYLTKKGDTPRDISEYIKFTPQYSAIAMASNLRSTQTTNTASGARAQAQTGATSARELYVLQLNFSFVDYLAIGINAWSNSLRRFGRGENTYFSYVPTTGNASGMTGYSYYEEADDTTVFEGGVTLSGGIPIIIPLIE